MARFAKPLGYDDDGASVERIELEEGWALLSSPFDPSLVWVQPIEEVPETPAYGEEVDPIGHLAWIDAPGPTYH